MIAEVFRIRGQVQGVGFRPFVWRIAREHGLAGEVLNDAQGVLIHAQGRPERLEAFARALRDEAPPLSRVDAVERVSAPLRDDVSGFSIAASAPGAARTRVAPDARLCDACAAEIADPSDRRHRYPFANCTHCGPRFTIVESVPYDRAATTMRGFPLCPSCRAEYDDPEDRRFHAQPVACPACGPRAWLETPDGRVDATGGDPAAAIDAAADLLRAGAVIAVKGLGGFHLACDALQEAAVAALRARKRRPAKPFALMATLSLLRRHAAPTPDEEDLLAAPSAPILLLARGAEPLAPSVAPGQATLGWMLPTTPLHALLCEAADAPLVMTSGNRSGEPMAIGDDEARDKLAPFVDGFLMHDRPIARRLDDSVARSGPHGLQLLRRARGFAPATLPLPEALAGAPPILAYGGHLKAALCLTRDGAALPSHHLGDLDDALTAEAFATAERDYAELFDHAPEALACDLHPDYRATRRAEDRAGAEGLPLHRVQHHHAHVAAVMAEHRLAPDRPVVGLCLDGLGWGEDGSVWGGEILLCRYAGFRRLGRLAPVALPGGEAAQREPWRNLLAQLDAAGLGAEADRLFADKPLAPLRAAIAAGVNAPLSSSAGRLFDAVAVLAGCAPDRLSHEGEAAMSLEALAGRAPDAPPLRFHVDAAAVSPQPDAPTTVAPETLRLDWPAALALAHDPPRLAAAFHRGLAETLARRALIHAEAEGAAAIALSGGVFANRLLTELTVEALRPARTLLAHEAPMNDGGLALGQAAVAAARTLNL